MDAIGLSLKMKRLTHWLDGRTRPDSLVRKQFRGAPFGDCYVTIDPGHQGGFSRAAVAAIVLAMGLENAVFQNDGGAGLGLTYITGALVKVGQFAATALTGGPRWAWAPNLLLWATLVAGSACGALAYHWINIAAIWFAALAALGLSAFAAATAHR